MVIRFNRDTWINKMDLYDTMKPDHRQVEEFNYESGTHETHTSGDVIMSCISYISTNP